MAKLMNLIKRKSRGLHLYHLSVFYQGYGLELNVEYHDTSFTTYSRALKYARKLECTPPDSLEERAKQVHFRAADTAIRLKELEAGEYITTGKRESKIVEGVGVGAGVWNQGGEKST